MTIERCDRDGCVCVATIGSDNPEGRWCRAHAPNHGRLWVIELSADAKAAQEKKRGDALWNALWLAVACVARAQLMTMACAGRRIDVEYKLKDGKRAGLSTWHGFRCTYVMRFSSSGLGEEIAVFYGDWADHAAAVLSILENETNPLTAMDGAP